MLRTRYNRVAATAAMGALTVLLATGCSFSIGNAEEKDEPTASESAAAPEEEPTAEEQPTGEAPSAPENEGVNEGGAVHKARVAQTIADKLAADTGRRPDKVTCPEHLPARVGATIRCELTAGSDILGVTVTATAVNGKQVNYTFKVDDSAR
ncbi:putative secreted protein [Streptomyces davaonensis JCM 4913]|uniref:Putative secreted protein n=1 Tax=Streptomyces davaonensis (strain DSM 101723 / JCM 4913 / KCC S-0913 / 768) TaxID=1214101 RepID=K4R9N2_STRDJ|nr:DUF4333 domain-containing protein [Streptomyces davaonensis]CCK29374.1 putative secreted protein [Streptomyces davaonensis JCM 4913]